MRILSIDRTTGYIQRTRSKGDAIYIACVACRMVNLTARTAIRYGDGLTGSIDTEYTFFLKRLVYLLPSCH